MVVQMAIVRFESKGALDPPVRQVGSATNSGGGALISAHCAERKWRIAATAFL